ncbi:hypothetical protein V8B97DRAFT_1975301 [Scleroderma yunnanense]
MWYLGHSQVLLPNNYTASSIWPNDTLLIPLCASSASAFLLILRVVISSYPFQVLRKCVIHTLYRPKEQVLAETRVGESESVIDRPFITDLGGPVVYGFKLARVFGCIAFLGLEVVTLLKGDNQGSLSHQDLDWSQLAICTTAVYTTLLSIISVTARSRYSRIVASHLVVVLLVLFSTYAYRDLYPLLTFTQDPQDLHEGRLLWVKVSILTITSIALPLLCPTQYIPVDPANPSEFPHPEQTASWLLFSLYIWLDPIVFRAQKVSHLSHDQLPPLADYDYARYLTKLSFPHLNTSTGKKRRHLFFGLLRLIFYQAVSTLAAPIGINQLLEYLENGGVGATIRPWVWIIYMFVGQFFGTVIYQWYLFVQSRLIVRTECIITQLIFEHALRIRMKAELPDTDKGALPSIATVPNNTSIAESSTIVESSPEESPDEDQSSAVSTIASSAAPGSQRDLAKQDTADNKPRSSAVNLVGKINNLVTTDLNSIVEGRDFLMIFPYAPLQIGLCIWFLYHILGWSAFAGLVVMVLLIPIPGMVANKIQSVQIVKMEKTDARVQLVTETMNVLRMVKLFGWEKKMDERISEKREVELLWIWKFKLLDLTNNVLNFLIPLFTMMACYATYTLIMGKELTASRVFSSMTAFDILQDQLNVIFWEMSSIIQAKVSIARVNDFLNNTELLDCYSAHEDHPQIFHSDPDEYSGAIGFRDATFTWSNDSAGTLTPSKRKFDLRIDDEVVFRQGCVNLVVGPTGSGKTSLLMALLGEMHFTPSSPCSWFNLPRKDGVAYAAQESWIQNETIIDNILFGAPYDEARYKKVIHQCAVERDLQLFEAGDRTEVGEKGLTLRVTLARAVYSSAQILLLDDALAALDVHTSKWIVDKCFGGDLIKGRTVILVTHNVAMASSVAQYVVSLTPNGRVASQGTVSEAIARDDKLAAEMVDVQEALQRQEDIACNTEVVPMNERDGKLVMAEEILEGHVSWPAMKLYLASVGGSHAIYLWSTFLFLMMVTEVTNIFQTWFLGYWSSQYDNRPASEVDVKYYLTIYALLLFLGNAFYVSGYISYFLGTLRASRTIHKRLVEAVLGTTLRSVALTGAPSILDGHFSLGLGWVLELTLGLLLRLGAVVLSTPVFLLPGILVGLSGIWVGRVYMRAQLSVKREKSIAKAPVLGHFGAAIAGLTSIRAYGAQAAFKSESLDRIDLYSKSARMYYNLNRWVTIRIDFIGALFTATLATYLVYWRTSEASNVGFSLNMAVFFSSVILVWIRILNDVEVDGNVERVNSYINIEQEPKPTNGGCPPAYWPATGDLVVNNLSARYSIDGPNVLHDLSFHVESGQRVGIVGRTGSGKSSLTLALLRCIITEGAVYYDGIPTTSINLDVLRSNITIIPQILALLSGTLRQNLDPFDEHDDATLNDALRSAGLFTLQDDTDEDRLTLDSAISGGGSNLSVGQRQIIALARAMVRGSKLLILDEDYKTDTAIQTSLRHEIRGVTQLIIAHRLQTIIDADKIMVLDAGRIVEFGSPKELLQNENGMLRALVDESGEKDILCNMASGERFTPQVTVSEM